MTPFESSHNQLGHSYASLAVEAAWLSDITNEEQQQLLTFICIHSKTECQAEFLLFLPTYLLC